jgi:serine O-acetyltransferase
VLGSIRLGAGCKVGAGSVVLHDVPAGWTAVGNPARNLPPGSSPGDPESSGEGLT